MSPSKPWVFHPLTGEVEFFGEEIMNNRDLTVSTDFLVNASEMVGE